MDGAGDASLLRLHAGHNRLRGFPCAAARLQRLQVLDLPRNEIGALPPEVGDCASLTRLDLSHNWLKGKVPADIVKCANLTWLELSGNQYYTGGPCE